MMTHGPGTGRWGGVHQHEAAVELQLAEGGHLSGINTKLINTTTKGRKLSKKVINAAI